MTIPKFGNVCKVTIGPGAYFSTIFRTVNATAPAPWIMQSPQTSQDQSEIFCSPVADHTLMIEIASAQITRPRTTGHGVKISRITSKLPSLLVMFSLKADVEVMKQKNMMIAADVALGYAMPNSFMVTQTDGLYAGTNRVIRVD